MDVLIERVCPEILVSPQGQGIASGQGLGQGPGPVSLHQEIQREASFVRQMFRWLVIVCDVINYRHDVAATHPVKTPSSSASSSSSSSSCSSSSQAPSCSSSARDLLRLRVAQLARVLVQASQGLAPAQGLRARGQGLAPGLVPGQGLGLGGQGQGLAKEELGQGRVGEESELDVNGRMEGRLVGGMERESGLEGSDDGFLATLLSLATGPGLGQAHNQGLGSESEQAPGQGLGIAPGQAQEPGQGLADSMSYSVLTDLAQYCQHGHTLQGLGLGQGPAQTQGLLCSPNSLQAFVMSVLGQISRQSLSVQSQMKLCQLILLAYGDTPGQGLGLRPPGQGLMLDSVQGLGSRTAMIGKDDAIRLLRSAACNAQYTLTIYTMNPSSHHTLSIRPVNPLSQPALPTPFILPFFTLSELYWGALVTTPAYPHRTIEMMVPLMVRRKGHLVVGHLVVVM